MASSTEAQTSGIPADDNNNNKPAAAADEEVSRSQIQEQADSIPSGTPGEMSQLSQKQQPTPPPLSSSSPPLSNGKPNIVADSTAADTTAGASESNSKSDIRNPSDATAVGVSPSNPPTTEEAKPLPSPPPPATSSQSPRASPTSLPPLQTSQYNPPTSSTMTPGILSSLPRSAPQSAFPISPTDPSSAEGPSVLINLILLNGARHPYKIDRKYLRKRNVGSSTKSSALDSSSPEISEEEEKKIDPFSISVYTLKELIWRDWRDEWDPRPGIPGSIRLIYFGRLLEDKLTLRDCKFHPQNPNVVHMTVRPQSLVDEEENAKLHQKGGGSILGGHGRGDGDDETQAGCCRCLVM